MKKIESLLLIFCMLAVSILAEESVTKVDDQNPSANQIHQREVEIAKSYLDLIIKGDYKSASNMHNKEMKKALKPTMLKLAYEKSLGSLGEYDSVSLIQTIEQSNKGEKYVVVVLLGIYEKGEVEFTISVSEKGTIGGFYFNPTLNYTQPNYVDTNKIQEIPVKIGQDLFVLDGILTIPKNLTDKVAVVVMVQGSGPNDMDESIGPNKPFKDIALGLAMEGVASLRYNKRTFQYGEKLSPDLTVKEEVVDDAVFAVQFLASREEIDHKAIFVLGHSLGAMMTPRIAERILENNEIVQKPEGIIMMAPPARDLEELILDQTTRWTRYFFFALPKASKQEIRDLEKKIEQIKDESLPKDEMFFGASAGYFYHLHDYDPRDTTEKVSQEVEVLILQGNKDYQVNGKDLKLWREKFDNHHSVEIRTYKGLNHLFMPVQFISTGLEYLTPSTVKQAVILDIAEFVKKSSKKQISSNE